MGSALLDWWLTRLKPSEQKIILALQEHGPLDTASLAEATGYEVSGGFKNILGHLRSLGIITPARVSPISLHEDIVDR